MSTLGMRFFTIGCQGGDFESIAIREDLKVWRVVDRDVDVVPSTGWSALCAIFSKIERGCAIRNRPSTYSEIEFQEIRPTYTQMIIKQLTTSGKLVPKEIEAINRFVISHSRRGSF